MQGCLVVGVSVVRLLLDFASISETVGDRMLQSTFAQPSGGVSLRQFCVDESGHFQRITCALRDAAAVSSRTQANRLLRCTATVGWSSRVRRGRARVLLP